MWDRLKKLLQPGAKQGEVGWFPEAVYNDGTPIALVAATLNYGTAEAGANHNVAIPARPFMDGAIQNNKDKWARIYKDRKESGASAEAALEEVCIAAREDIQESIETGNWEKLAKSTIEARARRHRGDKSGNLSQPLIDTGEMINSVNYKISGA